MQCGCHSGAFMVERVQGKVKVVNTPVDSKPGIMSRNLRLISMEAKVIKVKVREKGIATTTKDTRVVGDPRINAL